MKQITVLTLFPKLIANYCNTSIIFQAQKKQLINFNIVNIRDFSSLTSNQVDDYQYGGGAGMVLMLQPIEDALDVSSVDNHVILLSPRGKRFDQQKAFELTKLNKPITFICGHYEGIDERIDERIDEYISIGDFVVTSGEIAALVVIDAVTRLIPGVINPESLIHESFNNFLLDYPVYTKPQSIAGKIVPEVLVSGNHAKIAEFRLQEQIKITQKYRPDLWKKYQEKKQK